MSESKPQISYLAGLTGSVSCRDGSDTVWIGGYSKVTEPRKPETMTPTMWFTCICGVRTLALALDAGASLRLDVKIACKCGQVSELRMPA